MGRKLALELGLPYINTGLMYRAVARRALDGGVDVGDGGQLSDLARSIHFELDRSTRPPELSIDGRAPERSLFSEEVEAIVSLVARHPSVREVMRREQRALGRAGCVMEGRDIGTAVFPDAAVKFFLSATPDIRAMRRERERGGVGSVAWGVAVRDALDARTNPFIPGPDAHVIDTSLTSADQVFAQVERTVRLSLRRASR